MKDNNGYSIYVDSEGSPPADDYVNWSTVRSLNKFIATIMTLGQPNFISFSEEIGHDCAMFLLTKGIKPIEGFDIHRGDSQESEKIKEVMAGVMILNDF